MTTAGAQTDDELTPICAAHFRFGWWTLLLYAAGGLFLEALHGFKATAYLSASNETRRLMWTLAHAHGALLAIVNVLFALSSRQFPLKTPQGVRRASFALLSASVILPVGFFGGGVRVYGGDPSAAVILVPVGAASLLVGLAMIARQTTLPSRKVDPPRKAAPVR